MILRPQFYDGYRGDMDHTLKAIEKTLAWRKEYGWYTLSEEDFSEDVKTGKCYFFGKCKEDSPVLYWRMSRHIAVKNVDRTVRFIVWTMEKALREGIVTDRVTVVIDRMDATSENIEGIHFFRLLASTFQTHFPELLQKIFIFPSNWLLWTVWNVAKPFLDATVVAKISILGPKEYQSVIHQQIGKENLPQRYGGEGVDPYDEKTPSIVDSAVSVRI
ncbi:hypothetical protein HK102_005543 [Quaeritorhiza haematococci]|nr:hypothetical protein HK102_005543 [Quaeritorhiza haematococci]